jgi:hypothetical protein
VEHVEAIGWVRADNGEWSLGVRVRDIDHRDAAPRLGHLIVCSNREHKVGPAGGLLEFHPIDDQETFRPLLGSPSPSWEEARKR